MLQLKNLLEYLNNLTLTRLKIKLIENSMCINEFRHGKMNPEI